MLISKGKGTTMSEIMNRLKVTAAKQSVPQKAKAIVAVKTRMPAVSSAKVVDGKKCVVATVGKPTVKMPAATTAKVAETNLPPVGNASKATQASMDKAHEEALVKSCIQSKLNPAKPNMANKTNSEIIEQYRIEYNKFLKQLESMDFGSLVFGQNNEKKEETPATKQEPAPKPVETPKPEPAKKVEIVEKPEINLVKETVDSVPLGDFVNGISVGEEAGDEVVVPVKKTRKRKKSVIA